MAQTLSTTPNTLVAHEIAHGAAACMAEANCKSFAISSSPDCLTCTAHWPPLSATDQFAETLAGPLLDMMAAGTISGTSDERDIAAAVLKWLAALEHPIAPFELYSDMARCRRFARALDSGEQFAAIQLAMGAACIAYRLFTDRPMQLTMLARRLDSLDEGEALVFTGAQIADAAAGNEPLPQVAVDLHGWLAGTTERANDAMGVEAELIVRELNVRAT